MSRTKFCDTRHIHLISSLQSFTQSPLVRFDANGLRQPTAPTVFRGRG